MHAEQFYHAIISDSDRHAQRRNHIKHVGFVLPTRNTCASAKGILSVCDGLLDFAVIGGDVPFLRHSGQQLEAQAGQMRMRLSRLTVDVVELCKPEASNRRNRSSPDSWIPASYPHLFSHLTHLDVRSSLQEDAWAPWAGLASLPLLTHLAFHVDGGRPAPVQVLRGALAHCTSLRVLILLIPGDGKYDDVVISDDRFCVKACVDAVGDWVKSCRGDYNFWACRESRWSQASK